MARLATLIVVCILSAYQFTSCPCEDNNDGISLIQLFHSDSDLASRNVDSFPADYANRSTMPASNTPTSTATTTTVTTTTVTTTTVFDYAFVTFHLTVTGLDYVGLISDPSLMLAYETVIKLVTSTFCGIPEDEIVISITPQAGVYTTIKLLLTPSTALSPDVIVSRIVTATTEGMLLILYSDIIMHIGGLEAVMSGPVSVQVDSPQLTYVNTLTPFEPPVEVDIEVEGFELVSLVADTVAVNDFMDAIRRAVTTSAGNNVMIEWVTVVAVAVGSVKVTVHITVPSEFATGDDNIPAITADTVQEDLQASLTNGQLLTSVVTAVAPLPSVQAVAVAPIGVSFITPPVILTLAPTPAPGFGLPTPAPTPALVQQTTTPTTLPPIVPAPPTTTVNPMVRLYTDNLASSTWWYSAAMLFLAGLWKWWLPTFPSLFGNQFWFGDAEIG